MDAAKKVVRFPVRPSRFSSDESRREWVTWNAHMQFTKMAEINSRIHGYFEQINDDPDISTSLVNRMVQEWRRKNLADLEEAMERLVEETGLCYVEVSRIFDENSHVRSYEM